MNDVCMFCKQPVKFSLDGEPVAGLGTGIGNDNTELVHISCLNAERDKHRMSLDESTLSRTRTNHH